VRPRRASKRLVVALSISEIANAVAIRILKGSADRSDRPRPTFHHGPNHAKRTFGMWLIRPSAFMLGGNPEKEGRVKLSYEDQEALRCAKALLENPSLAAKITGLIGMPIEKALKLLPDKWAEVVNGATRKSLETALQAALLTLDDKPQPNSWEFLHKLAVRAIGAGGGCLRIARSPSRAALIHRHHAALHCRYRTK
jgi:hypothetical protein